MKQVGRNWEHVGNFKSMYFDNCAMTVHSVIAEAGLDAIGVLGPQVLQGSLKAAPFLRVAKASLIIGVNTLSPTRKN